MLYIKGFYLNETESQRIRIYADDIELNYSETKMSDDEEDESTKEDDVIEIDSHIFVQIPEIDTTSKIKIIYEDKDNKKTILTLSRKMLKMIIQNRVYNIDALEKLGECYVIRGWIIYEHSFDLKLFNDDGEEIPSNTKLYERLDVEMAYPEMNEKEKVSGFRCEFNYANECNVQFKLRIDNHEVITILDTKSDFSGNKKLFAVLKKSLRINGIRGTFLIIVRHFRHPIVLIKRVSNKLGITEFLNDCLKSLKGIIGTIEEFYLAKAKYAGLIKKYPYAMKRLLCLSEMPQVKRDKSRHYSGDVKFSVLVPLFNTPVEFLNEMIESVQMQTYENWELCLADGSDEKHAYVGEICGKYQKK